MRRLPILASLGLFLCALAQLPVRAEYEEREQALRSEVEQARTQLQQDENEEKRAGELTDGYYENTRDFRNRANISLFRKDHFQNKANTEQRHYEDARKAEEQARRNSDTSARDYLKAEETYKNELGHYVYPDKQEYWTGRLGEAYSVESGRKKRRASDDDAPATTQDMMRSVTDMQKAFSDPNMSQGQAAGYAEAKTNQIKGMTRDMMANALKTIGANTGGGTPGAYTSGAARPLTGRIPAARPPARRTDKLRERKKMPPREQPGRSRKKVEISPDRRLKSPYAKQNVRPVYDLPLLRSGENKLLSGDLKGALRDAEEYIRLHPDSAMGYQLKAKILSRQREFQSAAEAALRSLKIDPNNADALRTLAWAQLHMKDYEGVIATTDRLLNINPRDAQALLMRAFAYEKLGMRDEMLAALKAAAEIDHRYMNHYLKALNEEELFNPDRTDSRSLLDEIDYTPPFKLSPKIALGGALILIALTAAALPALMPLFATLLRRFRPRRAEPKPASAQQPAPVPEPAVEGSMLGGKYSLQGIIGHGGMGKVWRAYDTSLERDVAVKQALANLSADETGLRQLYVKEARIMAELRHPNIVNIFEIFDRPDGVFLVLEYVTGKTLQQLLLKHKRISWERTRPILAATAGALVYAHEKGIIHRDLKPSNIMISDRGYVKVMDFGIARNLGSTDTPMPAAVQPARQEVRVAHTQHLAGTPAYMPPEAYQGVVSPATDTFALGACLYEMLTGEPPFGNSGLQPGAGTGYRPATQVVAGLDPRLDALIARSLEMDREKRIATPGEFAARLRSID
ncbi:MAG: protein kinase [Elusimicrobiota bacterium]